MLVAETGKYRIRRVWLKEPKMGQDDIFIDNLPGFPDGISSNGTRQVLAGARDSTPGTFRSHCSLSIPAQDRRSSYRKFLQPAPQRYSFVVALDPQGRVVENLQNGSPDCYAQIANVVEHNGTLYFGSIGEDTVGRFLLP